jgi:aspartate/methionine/tyrosine aminotransferase
VTTREDPWPLASRVGQIEPFQVMNLLARAQALEAAGRTIVHMEIGESDFPTPAPVVAAGVCAVEQGYTRYTPAAGLPALRDAISAYYQQHYRIDIDPARIVVTPGGSGALQLALALLVNPGQQVLISDPGYPCNRHLIHLFGAKAVAVKVSEYTAFQPDLAGLKAAWSPDTVAVMLASPANPTGTLLSKVQLADILGLATAGGARLIVDEIYHGLIYDDATPWSALNLSDQVFVVNSFSKYFGMTGWRLGWLVVPQTYVNHADKLAKISFSRPPRRLSTPRWRPFIPPRSLSLRSGVASSNAGAIIWSPH